MLILEKSISTISPDSLSVVAKCEEINNAVKDKKSDVELKKLITEGHNIFHEIVEKYHKHE